LNATVNQERDSTLDPIHDLRQRVNRRGRSIEISPTMIRHHDGLRAGLDRKLGILRVEDALEDERQLRERAKRFDILPGGGHAARIHDFLLAMADVIEMRRRHVRREAKPGASLSIARADDWRVHRQADRLTA
jgi:hypothetical protein